MSRYRETRQILPAPLTSDGAGVSIHRAFPNNQLSELDPFLLLDHMGPMYPRPGEATGFPDHPHRGFETVTYMLHGEFRHRDSFGHSGVIGPGDVQWMTAGSGLVHSEMPGESVVKNGGRLEGFQLWVNLPAKDKMKAPRYQEISALHLPVARSSDGRVEVKIIAGDAMGQKGAVETQIPIQYLHIKLAAGAKFVQEVPSNLAAMLYVFEGSAEAGGVKAARFHLVELGDGDSVEITSQETAELLLLAAQPIREPIARYGPFVMNTEAEVRQAFRDFREGRMGRIE
jgi:redox-sensitive bicupin YhaK (pirin superfamily)